MAKANRPQPKAQAQPTTSETTRPTPTRQRAAETPSVFGKRNDQLIFGRENYKWMLIGLAIMVVGFICMAGGRQAPDQWNEAEIYSPMRIIVAPILVLAGLAVEIYAIFKRNNVPTTNAPTTVSAE